MVFSGRYLATQVTSSVCANCRLPQPLNSAVTWQKQVPPLICKLPLPLIKADEYYHRAGKLLQSQRFNMVKDILLCPLLGSAMVVSFLVYYVLEFDFTMVKINKEEEKLSNPNKHQFISGFCLVSMLPALTNAPLGQPHLIQFSYILFHSTKSQKTNLCRVSLLWCSSASLATVCMGKCLLCCTVLMTPTLWSCG